MPLIKSPTDKAFKKNVGNLMNEVGESPHVQSREQALAIAYATKRRAKRSMRNGQVSDRAKSRMRGSDNAA